MFRISCQLPHTLDLTWFEEVHIGNRVGNFIPDLSADLIANYGMTNILQYYHYIYRKCNINFKCSLCKLTSSWSKTSFLKFPTQFFEEIFEVRFIVLEISKFPISIKSAVNEWIITFYGFSSLFWPTNTGLLAFV